MLISSQQLVGSLLHKWQVWFWARVNVHYENCFLHTASGSMETDVPVNIISCNICLLTPGASIFTLQVILSLVEADCLMLSTQSTVTSGTTTSLTSLLHSPLLYTLTAKWPCFPQCLHVTLAAGQFLSFARCLSDPHLEHCRRCWLVAVFSILRSSLSRLGLLSWLHALSPSAVLSIHT